MGFGAAVRSAFSKYGTSRGRASRSEFWWFQLFVSLVGLVAQILDIALSARSHQGPGGPISGLWGLAMLIPSVAISIRRLHDVGRSGWWWLLTALPLIGWLVLLFWYVWRGNAGSNAYGPDPLAGPAGGLPP